MCYVVHSNKKISNKNYERVVDNGFDMEGMSMSHLDIYGSNIYF